MRLQGALAASVLLAAIATAPSGRAAGRDEGARLMNELMSGKVAVGGPFTLPDTAGSRRSLAEFRGKLVLLYFGYVGCPDVCPTDLAIIGKAMRLLGERAADVQPLFVTLDPVRDTPAVLREYLAAFDRRFIGLRGSDAEVRRVARLYKVAARKVPGPGGAYFIDHGAFTFLLDCAGRYVAFLPPGTHADRMETVVRETLASPACSVQGPGS